jgi:CTP:molybdopterin cytidylyltransferase MocA
LFGRDWFSALGALTGDQGARTLIADAPTFTLRASALVDIDMPGDR